MLSLKVIKAGGEDYYLDLADGDYYFKGGEPPGKWLGTGCGFFGLFGTVERTQFKRIFNGFHPKSESGPSDPSWHGSLVYNAGDKDRRAAYDLTFSAPKSVSVLWSQASPEMRLSIERIHDQAVADTLTFVEQTLAYSRTGKGGSGPAVEAKLVAANFQHGTSRAEDPQLHSHLLVMNVGVDEFDKTRSIEAKPIYRNKMLLGAIYRSHLAHSLHREFGFNASRKGDSFDIQGVPDEVIQHHSTRRKQILARLKETGKRGAVAAAHAALETREKKKHRPRGELIYEWQKENESLGFTDKTLQALVCPVKRDYERYIDKILNEALENIQRRLTHFTAHGFLREALYVAPAYGVSPEAMHKPVHDFLRESKEVVPIATPDGSNRFVATSVLKQELKVLKTLRKLHDCQGCRVDDRTLATVLEKNTHLNAEQQAAVTHITQSDKAIRIVQGYAGTGKTTMLRTAVQAWQKVGYNVIGACFTGAAADTLQDEIGVPCDTINMTLADFPDDGSGTLRKFGMHTAKQLVRAAQKKKTYQFKKPQRPDINSKTIVLLDEAGMINTRHMLMLMEWVQANGATLVLTGDAAQLPAVEGGSPFLSLSKRVGYAEMTQIRRQQDEWARAAALHMARGEIAEALALYDKHKLVMVEDDLDDALERLVKDWAKRVWDHPEDARILTLTNDQADTANRRAQEELIRLKTLDPSSRREIQDVDEKSGRAYGNFVHVGDRILFTKNDRKLGVRNGQTGTVLKFIPIGRLRKPGLCVKLDNGKVVKVPLSFQRMRLGYASTVHKSQGATYSEVFVLLGGAAQNQPLSYVQGTRSRLATRFYTEKALYDQSQGIEESVLISQMEQEVELSLAVDLFIPTGLASKPEDLIARLLDDWRNRSAAHNKSSLVVTKNYADEKKLNDECNRVRYAMAQADWEQRQGKQQSAMPMFQHDGMTVFVSERLRIMEQSISTGLIKGELATVTAISPQHIELHLDRGKSVSLARDNLPRFKLGYALTFDEAATLKYQPEHAYLLEPDKFIRPDLQPTYSTAIDYFKWNPTSAQPTTIFSPTIFYSHPSTVSTPPQNTWAYMTAQQTQMAAASHHQVYQANQQACWQAHQFQHTTQITREHDHTWKHKI